MAKKKIVFEELTKEQIDVYRNGFVRAALRRASYRWPFRNIATTKARVERGVYRCASCLELVRNKDKKLDHVDPVVIPEKGHEGWDKFVERLFIGLDGWQVLCAQCHSTKTKEENDRRKRCTKKATR